MDSKSHERWSNFEVVSKEDDFDIFPFPSQPLSLDFSFASDFRFNDLPIQQTAFDVAVPPMDAFVHDPFYSVMDFEPIPIQGDLWSIGSGNGLSAWNPEIQNDQPLLCDSSTNAQAIITTSEENTLPEKMIRRQREQKGDGVKTLSRENISRYFYLPITQAAKELKVGLTLLKKRCRELGIRRWPHRKLMSLQTLINNVQEMQEMGGHLAEKKLKETIQILEHEKKLMEEIPDMQLEGQTKRLRQACFKANYKRRKLIGMMESQSSFQTFKATSSLDSGPCEEINYDGEEDLKFIVASCSRELG